MPPKKPPAQTARRGRGNPRGNRPPLQRPPEHDVPPHRMTTTRSDAAQSAIVRLSIPSLVFGLGFTMIQRNFWAGIALMTVAIPLFWWMIFRVFRTEERYQRLSGVLITSALYLLILWILLVPAPLDVLLFAEPGNYPEGTNIYGIEWKPNFSELGIVLTNDTDIDYTNLDVYLRTDLMIANGGVAPGTNQCSIEADLPGVSIADARLTATDEKGNKFSLPVFDRSRPIIATDYRMRCARFAGKSKIDSRFSIVGKDLFSGSHIQPKWGKLSADYDASFRHRSRFFKQCFVANCGEMDEKIR
jgi:hypothetical protein